jgi:hypothetical protein
MCLRSTQVLGSGPDYRYPSLTRSIRRCTYPHPSELNLGERWRFYPEIAQTLRVVPVLLGRRRVRSRKPVQPNQSNLDLFRVRFRLSGSFGEKRPPSEVAAVNV